jgi:type VI secretion system secreted protein VgrG
MSWFTQPRTLDISGAALPVWRDMPLFTVSRLSGTEKLGRLYDYTVELATIDTPGLYVSQAQKLVQIDQLVGTEVTVRIAIEGSGTYVAGMTGGAGAANLGAGIRELTAVVTEAQCVGADERRAFYRLRLRPWLWLAMLTTDSRIFQDCTVVEISRTVLDKYPYLYEMRLAGPGFGRQYPKRDYQRQFWESDMEFLDRLWQEWGMTFHYERGKLILCDSPGAYRKHGPAYQTLRYLDRDGQRIDEEHVHQFSVARSLTTGKVTLTDYDYTRSLAKLARKESDYRKRANDNAEEYGWGDFSQPLAGSMGLSADPNEVRF